MTRQDHIRLLSALWRMGFFVNTAIEGDNAERIVFLSQGEPTESYERFVGARIAIDDVVYCGTVAIGSETALDETIVLRVVESECPKVLDLNGVIMPQVKLTIPEGVMRHYGVLVDGDVKDCRCGDKVALMDSLHRADLFSRLVVERLQRKCGVVESINEENYTDWNQTMYAMLFRAMGDHRNQAAFQLLANRVPYHVVARERLQIENVEALLLGGSGLLRRYAGDEYTRRIQSNFEYLARKYSIRPMMGGEWTLTGINPNNSPIMRIIQLAGYVSRTDFIFSKLMACRTVEDIHKVLGGGAGCVSEYWEEHFAPGKASPRRSKKLGNTKINLLAINFVVPLMFAYGRALQSEEIKEMALDILEQLPPESNYITKHWTARGVSVANAFDSQALIQLENEYCAARGCWRCHIGRGEIKKSLKEL